MVSIIVPVYKSEKTLRRCIQSLTSQTYRDIEIIMTVDGPPDKSGILADQLSKLDERIKVIHQMNQGVSMARNAGIEYASGEYIQFVDSDDYLDVTACQKLVEQMELNHSDLIICGFHHLYFGKDVVKIPSIMGTIQLKTSKRQLLELYQSQFLNMPWNKLYKKEKIKEYFSKELDLGEDLLFNCNYLKNTQSITILSEALCYYLQDDRGTTLSTKKRTNRMENAFILYIEMKKFFMEIYKNEDTNGVLESKLLVEFLDEMEGLAFEESTAKKEKLCSIKSYYEGYQRIPNKEQIRLELLDYKVIAFFFRRGRIKSTYRLIQLRGLLVSLIRRIR